MAKIEKDDRGRRVVVAKGIGSDASSPAKINAELTTKASDFYKTIPVEYSPTPKDDKDTAELLPQRRYPATTTVINDAAAKGEFEFPKIEKKESDKKE